MAPILACGAPPIPPKSARGFDHEAATKVLASVDVARCEPPLGLKGSSHITVTFEPNGTVSSATMDNTDPHIEPWIVLAGTPTGACVERLFRDVRVGPFQPGPPMRVGQVISFGLYQKGGTP